MVKLGRIRALGIDTPENARDGNAAECLAIEATEVVDVDGTGFS